MKVEFKNAKTESKVNEDIQTVSKIYSAVENTLKTFLPSFSRKRTNEESMDSVENAPKKKKEAAFENDEDAERMEMTRIENGANQIENGATQNQDEENIK